MRTALPLLALTLPLPALGGSISASGVIAGPDSGAATANPAAVHYNPAALGGTEGIEILTDTQVSTIRIDATTTRNDGIDPNTSEEYGVAMARVKVPVALWGVSWKVLPDRLALGFGLTDAFVGGGDYSAGETGSYPQFESHQRYAGVTTKVITAHLNTSAALTLVEGVHIGASFKYIYDSFSAQQSSDPLGTEGLGVDGPYSADTLLEVDATGSHFGWAAGFYLDRWKWAKLGVSYTDNGTFFVEGTGKVTAPEMIGGGTPDAIIDMEMALPPVIHAALVSEINDQLTVGLSLEYQMWNLCCGTQSGDIVIGVTSEDGDPLGADAEDGLVLEISDTIYSPRRLWNSANLGINTGYWLSDRYWVGGRVGYNQNAVPDYAVSATNLDFENFGIQLAGRTILKDKFTLGLSYSKFFLTERVITNSAWDVRDTEDSHYVDDRFSPKNPYKASGNGTYGGAVDIVGLRLGMKI
jgi:long-subunit fatty acid transport protein